MPAIVVQITDGEGEILRDFAFKCPDPAREAQAIEDLCRKYRGNDFIDPEDAAEA